MTKGFYCIQNTDIPWFIRKTVFPLFLSVKNLIFEKSDFVRFLFLPFVTSHPWWIPSRQLNQIFPIGILQTTSYADTIFKHKTEFPCQQKAGKKQNSTKDFIVRCYPPKRQYAAKQNKNSSFAEKCNQIPFYFFAQCVFFWNDHIFT